MTAGKHLATYLNDHLAGSAAALELLEHLQRVQTNGVAEFARELHAEVSEDRQELETLMQRLGAPRSALRQTSAWLAEKFARLKLRLDDPAGGDLHLLESLEALSLGIEGKRLLWLSLSAVAAAGADWVSLDCDRLIRRAEDQRLRIEQFRCDAARGALNASSSDQSA